MAHEEAAVQHAHHTLDATNGAGSGDHSLVQAGLMLGGGELGTIAGEIQRISGRIPGKQLLEGAGVQNGAEAVIGADGEVVAALGAHRQMLGHGLAVAVLPALGAGDHFIAGDVVVPDGLHGQQPGPALGEDTVHALPSLSSSLRLNSSSKRRFSSKKAVVQAPRIKDGWYRI